MHTNIKITVAPLRKTSSSDYLYYNVSVASNDIDIFPTKQFSINEGQAKANYISGLKLAYKSMGVSVEVLYS